MEAEDIKARLKALAQNNGQRTKAAKLRELYDEVEATLSAGVSRSVVHQELGPYLGMSFQTFVGTLRRIRAKQAETTNEAKPKMRVQRGIAKPSIETTEGHNTQRIDQPSSNPVDISTIMSTVPDLQALAKASKGIKK